MASLSTLMPPLDNGLLPAYLMLVSVLAIGNALQNFTTLHYSRRIYNGLFVSNPALKRKERSDENPRHNPDDSINKLVPASSTGKDVEKANDQLTPLAARLFAVWTLITGVVRLYTAYDVSNQALYQLSVLTHFLAGGHYLSELLIFKTCRPSVPVLFPIFAGSTGFIWMTLQYTHYVGPFTLPLFR
ncbi:hypothetical protein PpBr36_03471 [Pyricularia pennisetigena]|uniref:hypothetical protein n=1 Tax=Pyricularia pennisetigena TaxID=1578925 RepID=UPI0011515DD5|nr:hypothetical protein PpBr36_03471 [Pyricularia pennisetigena]TLS31456.1 hypothetical protein PpBr36_03471 [Pyricularia pennisetigena]